MITNRLFANLIVGRFARVGLPLVVASAVLIGACLRMQGGPPGAGPRDRFAALPAEQREMCKALTGLGNAVQCDDQGKLHVFIFGDGITDGALRLVSSLRGLASLNITGDRFSDASAQQLSLSSDLGELTLSHNSITDKGVAHLSAMGHPESLVVLNQEHVDGSFIEAEDVGLSLVSLHFASTPIKGEKLSRVKFLKKLKSLSVDSGLIGDGALSFLAQSPSIEVLNITNAQFSDAGIEALSRLKTLVSLTAWSRSDRVTDDSLRSLGKLPRLATLHLFAAGLTDAGVASLSGTTSLEILGFHSSEISDVGIQTLSKLPKLKALAVWGRRISDHGVDILCSQSPNLEDLDLSGSDITERSLEFFSRLKRLRRLTLFSLGLPRKRLEEFRKRNPNVIVDF
jgi:internalin A